MAPENPALVASGEFAYRVAGTDIGLVITFEPSVDSVSFFFVHEVDEPGYGFAAASDGNQLATFESRVATTPADPANFVFAGPSEPIASIWLFGLPAYIDDFTFTPSPVPEPGRVLACGTALVAIFALRLLRMEAEKWWKTEADAPVVRVQEGWDRSFRDRVRSINGRMSVNGRTRRRLTHNVSCEGLRENNFSEPPAHEPKALEVFAT